jgi:hypothetical protein
MLALRQFRNLQRERERAAPPIPTGSTEHQQLAPAHIPQARAKLSFPHISVARLSNHGNRIWTSCTHRHHKPNPRDMLIGHELAAS